MSWSDSLRQASWRGVPFGVLGGTGKFGRRIAEHKYAFRDTPYAEDVGRAARGFTLTGFLLENDLVYGGGDVIQQRARMIAAAEAAGPGELVHPTMGKLQLSLPELSIAEKAEDGLYFELTFTFVEAGQRLYPVNAASTPANTVAAATATNTAAAAAYSLRATTDFASGAAVINQALATTASFVSLATTLVGDATGIINTVASLAGPYGRYFGGRLLGAFVDDVIGDTTDTVTSLIADGVAATAAVISAGAALTASIGTPATTATCAQSLASALLAATADPADGVRLTNELAQFVTATPVVGLDPIGLAMADIADASGDLFRRAAVAALAQASSTYQPASSNDAVTLMNTVTTALDNEINIAANQGEDATYAALRSLRIAVVQDLTTRGAPLAAMTTFTVNASLPAIVLALRFYRDAGRDAELVTQANPVHPLFMPQSFQALAQ